MDDNCGEYYDMFVCRFCSKEMYTQKGRDLHEMYYCKAIKNLNQIGYYARERRGRLGGVGKEGRGVGREGPGGGGPSYQYKFLHFLQHSQGSHGRPLCHHVFRGIRWRWRTRLWGVGCQWGGIWV